MCVSIQRETTTSWIDENIAHTFSSVKIRRRKIENVMAAKQQQQQQLGSLYVWIKQFLLYVYTQKPQSLLSTRRTAELTSSNANFQCMLYIFIPEVVYSISIQRCCCCCCCWCLCTYSIAPFYNNLFRFLLRFLVGCVFFKQNIFKRMMSQSAREKIIHHS